MTKVELETVEDALEFLAGYSNKNIGNPVPRLTSFDQPVINNLASKSLCHKHFSIKQGKLILVFLRKYRNQLRRAGINIEDILTTKRFRLTQLPAMTALLCFETLEKKIHISLSFPYDIRIIKLIHERNNSDSNQFNWDENDKKWTAELSIKSLEFAYELATTNQFYVEPLVKEYIDKMAKFRNRISVPSVHYENGKLIFIDLFDAQLKYLEEQFND